jgi:hypothetical protein
MTEEHQLVVVSRMQEHFVLLYALEAREVDSERSVAVVLIVYILPEAEDHILCETGGLFDSALDWDH